MIPIKLRCNHIFDFDCLLTWIFNKSPEATVCPLCDHKIESSDLIPFQMENVVLQKIVINWISGQKILLYINKNCTIHRLRSLISMGIFAWET